MPRDIFPNIIAMILSLVAMIQLCFAAFKIGGVVGRIFKLLIVGIFFAVFVHAGIELAERLGFIKEDYFLLIMGILIPTFNFLVQHRFYKSLLA